MFVIFDGNTPIHGPSDWNRLLFQNVLQDELEITTTLAASNTAHTPVEVSGTVVILPVVALDPPPINPKIEYYQGPFYTIYADRADMYYTVEPKNIDTVRAELKALVADERWRAEVSGVPVTIQSTQVTAYTDRESRNIFFQAAMLGADGVNWKFPEGFLLLSAADIVAVVTVIRAHVQACFDWETSTAAAIDSATTLAELNGISLQYGV